MNFEVIIIKDDCDSINSRSSSISTSNSFSISPFLLATENSRKNLRSQTMSVPSHWSRSNLTYQKNNRSKSASFCNFGNFGKHPFSNRSVPSLSLSERSMDSSFDSNFSGYFLICIYTSIYN